MEYVVVVLCRNSVAEWVKKCKGSLGSDGMVDSGCLMDFVDFVDSGSRQQSVAGLKSVTGRVGIHWPWCTHPCVYISPYNGVSDPSLV